MYDRNEWTLYIHLQCCFEPLLVQNEKMKCTNQSAVEFSFEQNFTNTSNWLVGFLPRASPEFEGFWVHSNTILHEDLGILDSLLQQVGLFFLLGEGYGGFHVRVVEVGICFL